MVVDLDSYNYFYPDDLVALNPLASKDKANMLVFKKNIFSHERVSDLLKHVSKNDLLVFNNTRVLPCSLEGQRVRSSSDSVKPKVSVTLNKAIDGNVWTTFCKPLKKLKKGDKIIFSKDLSAQVVSFNLAQCVMNFDSGAKEDASNYRVNFNKLYDNFGNILKLDLESGVEDLCKDLENFEDNWEASQYSNLLTTKKYSQFLMADDN